MLYRDIGLVKGVAFDSWRHIGNAVQAVKVYNMREVDELVFLDITATREGRSPDFQTVDDLADECFMPLTVGGGVRTPDDVGRLLSVGADKVAVNTAAVLSPGLLPDVAAVFGSQCLVVSIDVLRRPGGGLEVVTHSGTQPTGRDPVEFAREVEHLGAGEILLTSIARDGTMTGYDLDLIRQITEVVSVPVIASGGAGSYADMAAAILEGGASAVSATSIFQFTQQTPLEAKRALREHGIHVRP